MSEGDESEKACSCKLIHPLISSLFYSNSTNVSLMNFKHGMFINFYNA